MIKDKITPELKNRFSQEIQNTIKDGKEHGFNICINEKEIDEKKKLLFTNSCKGSECDIALKHIECPLFYKVQGNFHTHPDIATVREFVFKDIIISKEEMKSFMKDVAKKTETTLTIPSHHDVLDALSDKCEKKTNGTVCVGSDLVEDKVECWTVKKGISKTDCMKVKLRKKLESGITTPAKKWTRSLFNIEEIDI